MRRGVRFLLLTAVFAALLCGSALAAETVSGAGFYNIGTDPGVKVEPTTSSPTGKVETISANVDGGSDYETFYKGSDKLAVTCSGTAPGQQYMVMLVQGSLPAEADQIYYIDQKEAAGNSVSFDVYPMLPASGATQMTLYITSDDPDFTMKSVSLGYAANGTYVMETEDQVLHGTVTSSVTYAESGAPVSLSVHPDTGYQLSTIQVTGPQGQEVSLHKVGDGSVYTFTMPSYDVDVTAVFEKI